MKTKHSYSHFYVLLKEMPYSGDRSELKEFLVLRYTNYRTSSLKEMKSMEYRQMCADMKADILDLLKPDEDGDIWRKRVIAVIGKYLRNLKGKDDIREIKAIACRATHYEEFNLIPISRLRNLYSEFLNKNKDYDSIQKLTNHQIRVIAHLN